jgi:PPOX class probable FMN-dependent enzyme
MSLAHDSHHVTTLDQLEALFGEVNQASRKKEVGYLHPLYQAWIAASPFALLATAGPTGLDVSPRGDPPGFVAVEDVHTLLLPERRGNNRIDSLRNIVLDPRVALLFLIPGVGETLRVNGRASITTAPDVLARFVIDGKLPKCVVAVAVDSVFFQCARAIQRSKLWQPLAADVRSAVPTAGAILAALTEGGIDGGEYDRTLPSRQRSTLY